MHGWYKEAFEGDLWRPDAGRTTAISDDEMHGWYKEAFEGDL